MPINPKRNLRLSILRHMLVLLGIVSMLGPSAKASASIEHERKTLEAKVAAARKTIRNLGEGMNSPTTNTPANKQLTQWYPWGNWSNWRNF